MTFGRRENCLSVNWRSCVLCLACWPCLMWCTGLCVGRAIAQSVQRLATGCTVRGSNPDGGEIFLTCPHRPWVHPASYTTGTGSFPGVKRPGRGVDHPQLQLRLKKEYRYTSTPSLDLRGPFWGELYLLPGSVAIYLCFAGREEAVERAMAAFGSACPQHSASFAEADANMNCTKQPPPEEATSDVDIPAGSTPTVIKSVTRTETAENGSKSIAKSDYVSQWRYPDLTVQLFIHVGCLYGLYLVFTSVKVFTSIWGKSESWRAGLRGTAPV